MARFARKKREMWFKFAGAARKFEPPHLFPERSEPDVPFLSRT
jgi:hypothetical protein